MSPNDMNFNTSFEQRENFLREVAATKTKARWLAWTGFADLPSGLRPVRLRRPELHQADQQLFPDRSGTVDAKSVRAEYREAFPIGLIGWAIGVVGRGAADRGNRAAHCRGRAAQARRPRFPGARAMAGCQTIRRVK